ncbi:MAG: OsmC family protein [Pseudomonadota bacterium]
MVQVKQKTLVKMVMNARSPSHSRTDISIRDVASVIDEPVERGGTNEGLSPTETAVSALIGCTNVIGHKCANKLGVSMGHLTITATYEFDRRGTLLMEEVETPFKVINLEIAADGDCSEADLERVAAEVRKYCPLAKLFVHAGTVINETWKKAA